MLDFTRFRVLTFDCYGTLIDWESGIFAVLRPILAAHNRPYLIPPFSTLRRTGSHGRTKRIQALS